ncbi:MAG TPA: efflux RND transporter periplasmic adaptor subunit [Polyangiaceae bacterium]|jgi:HlyD family secretion protein|nr:MAG: Macrolide export protein MacA [Deltaproteobacteria bacterium ADurb.Bin207]HNS98191.1 efflux RND transporter periplasmic adaptor subunit [Polyangiaceae bacterium]HNZ22632.1 efflux RND transporter periplasmic adaptor subunit [Polyangiaceae bacterium]HOD21527.1 efflux RND transporter periplasmic adaptor subunit [Polyangiaceae bacterium]HOE48369.1 efflux RND transporter periplasmic adaptor subunit [Polyangiaceae bacterium]
MEEPASQRPSLTTAQNLGLGKGQRWWRWVRWLIVLAAIAGIVVGVLLWRAKASEAAKPHFETAAAEKGNILVTVSVTGKIQSVDAVEIGAEVSGKVDEVLVDFNDAVKKGQELARINTEQLDARVKEVRAQSAVAAASLLSAKATAAEAKANVARMKSLADRGLVSQKDLEAAVATAARAEASVAQANAQQVVNAASLESALSARDKAIIRSPIDGLVLSRSVEPGQTVAASLQAPVLFIVAKDLTTMVLKVDVDEADVGKVQKGQRATFTVDAYPGKNFEASVKSLKNVPTSGQDVVTYEAELSVDNQERLLRPGMTATATIITSEKKDVLVVPNTALRFTPPDVIASSTAATPRPGGALPGFGPPRFARPSGSAGGNRQKGAGQMGKVWVLENGEPKAIRLRTGATDGTRTEVVGGELTEGMQVLIDIVTGAK